MHEQKLLKSWAKTVIQKAEMYSEASIGMLHADIREQLRALYKATPELPDDIAARIAADRTTTKFASGMKTHTDALAAYIANSGKDGLFKAAQGFVPEIKKEIFPVNGIDLG